MRSLAFHGQATEWERERSGAEALTARHNPISRSYAAEAGATPLKGRRPLHLFYGFLTRSRLLLIWRRNQAVVR
jgi:hypothetical protein